MDCANFEKPKGCKSKIPVRAIKPPSRLPVPTKEIDPKKNHTRPNPSVIENVSSKAQVKTKKAILVPASRKELLLSHHTRVDYKDPVKTVTSRRLTNATNKRLTNAANPTVNKKSTSSELQTNIKVAKVSNQLANKKPLSKEIVTENKRFTYVASRNQDEKPTSGKISDINRRFTNISNKGSTLPNKKSTVIQRNIEKQSLKNVDRIETKRHTNFGTRINNNKPLEVQQPKKNLPSKESTPVADNQDKAVDNSPIKATNVDVKSKNDVSFDKKIHCSLDTQDPQQSVDKKQEDKKHFLQSDVEFVADERYRNQILFGQGISPNSKPQTVKNSSMRDTPSFFLKSKTALRALEKLEEEGRRVSMMRMSGLHPASLSRPSQATRIDPYQAVLRALENVDLAAEDRRVSTLRKNNIYLGSPRRDRSPMFKQQLPDPYKTALKKIEALQMKRKAKSAKKVTFNLEPSDLAPKVSKQNEKLNIKFLEEVKPDGVKEEQKEDNQSSISNLEPKSLTPELSTEPQLSTNSASVANKTERNLTPSHYHSMLRRICGQVDAEKVDLSNKQTLSTTIFNRFDSESNLNSISTTKNKSSPPKSILRSQNATKIGSKISDSVGPCFNTRNGITSSALTLKHSLNQSQTVLDCDSRRSTLSSYSLSTIRNNTSPPKSILKTQNAGKISSNISDSVGPCFRTLNRITSSILTSEDPRCSFLLSHPQATLEPSSKRSTLSRLCTPKPISFFPKPCAGDSISPEFLCRRSSQIVAHAPISTPMVMRTLAANLEETLSPGPRDDENSPVCLRLDFDEIEKENTGEAFPVCETPNKIPKFPIQNIRTNKQILDNLADAECSTILSFASFPVITQRSVWNPVAQILTHGDDMINLHLTLERLELCIYLYCPKAVKMTAL